MSNGSANANSNHWQPFIYLGESPHPKVEGRHGDNFPEQADCSAAQSPMTSLAMAQVGDRVRIVSLNCGESNNRLMGMGLVPGAVLEVISRVSPGSVIVSLQDQRLGLGTEMARRIQVTDADQCEADQYADQSRKHPQPSSTRTLETMQTTPDTSPVKLRDAAIGSVLRVIGYEPTMRDYKRKLLAMGLTPGTELRVMRHAPLGDPTEIQVRNFHLSLRKDEADALVVTPTLGGES